QRQRARESPQAAGEGAAGAVAAIVAVAVVVTAVAPVAAPAPVPVATNPATGRRPGLARGRVPPALGGERLTRAAPVVLRMARRSPLQALGKALVAWMCRLART
ncbi:hypothetical protein GGI13_007851, partial [Coemansia sp. RSA 455]